MKNKENKKWEKKNRKSHKNLWFRDAFYPRNRIFYVASTITRRNILYRFCFDFNYLSLRGHCMISGREFDTRRDSSFCMIYSIYRIALTIRDASIAIILFYHSPSFQFRLKRLPRGKRGNESRQNVNRV